MASEFILLARALPQYAWDLYATADGSPHRSLTPWAEHDQAIRRVEALSNDPRQSSSASFWSTYGVDSALLGQRAAEIVGKCIVSVRCADGDVRGANRLAPRSFAASQEAVFMHVWKSRREARRFHEALRRVAQAKFEHMIPSPIHVPLAALVCHQGAYVSVVWLPPVVQATPVKPETGSAMWACVEVLRAALNLPPGFNIPLHLAADGRFYLLQVGFIVSQCYPAALHHVPARLELLRELPDFFGETDVTNRIMLTTLLPRYGDALIDAFETKKSASSSIKEGFCGVVAHASGLNVASLGAAEHLLSSADAVHPAHILALEAMRAELVARTIKALAVEAMDNVRVPEYATSDVYELERREAAGDVIKNFLGNAGFFAETALPALRKKFPRLYVASGADEPFTLDRSELKPHLASIVQYVAQRLGVAMDASWREVSDFCTTAFSVNRLRPPVPLHAHFEASGETIPGMPPLIALAEIETRRLRRSSSAAVLSLNSSSSVGDRSSEGAKRSSNDLKPSPEGTKRSPTRNVISAKEIALHHLENARDMSALLHETLINVLLVEQADILGVVQTSHEMLIERQANGTSVNDPVSSVATFAYIGRLALIDVMPGSKLRTFARFLLSGDAEGAAEWVPPHMAKDGTVWAPKVLQRSSNPASACASPMASASPLNITSVPGSPMGPHGNRHAHLLTASLKEAALGRASPEAPSGLTSANASPLSKLSPPQRTPLQHSDSWTSVTNSDFGVINPAMCPFSDRLLYAHRWFSAALRTLNTQSHVVAHTPAAVIATRCILTGIHCVEIALEVLPGLGSGDLSDRLIAFFRHITRALPSLSSPHFDASATRIVDIVGGYRDLDGEWISASRELFSVMVDHSTRLALPASDPEKETMLADVGLVALAYGTKVAPLAKAATPQVRVNDVALVVVALAASHWHRLKTPSRAAPAETAVIAALRAATAVGIVPFVPPTDVTSVHNLKQLGLVLGLASRSGLFDAAASAAKQLDAALTACGTSRELIGEVLQPFTSAIQVVRRTIALWTSSRQRKMSAVEWRERFERIAWIAYAHLASYGWARATESSMRNVLQRAQHAEFAEIATMCSDAARDAISHEQAREFNIFTDTERTARAIITLEEPRAAESHGDVSAALGNADGALRQAEQAAILEKQMMFSVAVFETGRDAVTAQYDVVAATVTAEEAKGRAAQRLELLLFNESVTRQQLEAEWALPIPELTADVDELNDAVNRTAEAIATAVDGTEAAAVMADAILNAEGLCHAAINATELFTEANRYVNRVEAAAADVRKCGMVQFWQAEKTERLRVQQLAMTIVAESIMSVRCGEGDVKAAAAGPRTFILSETAVLLHVWKSRREARRFHEALRRVAQAKFEHMIPSPIHVPLAALVCHQGAYVSVVWLPPLASSTPLNCEKTTIAGALGCLLAAAMGLDPSQPIPLYAGADSRIYVMAIKSVMAPKWSELAKGVPLRVPLLRELAAAGISTESLPRDVTTMPLVMNRVAQAADVYLSSLASERFVKTAVSEGLGGICLHSFGLNVSLMLLLFKAVSARSREDLEKCCVDPLTQLRGEMVGRSLKALVSQAMDGVKTPDYAEPRMVEVDRAVAAEEVLQQFVGKAVFFDKVNIIARQKFFSKTVFTIERNDVKPCLVGVLQYVARKLGLVLDDSNKQVEGFEIAGVATQTFECPAAVKNYLVNNAPEPAAVPDYFAGPAADTYMQAAAALQSLAWGCLGALSAGMALKAANRALNELSNRLNISPIVRACLLCLIGAGPTGAEYMLWAKSCAAAGALGARSGGMSVVFNDRDLDHDASDTASVSVSVRSSPMSPRSDVDTSGDDATLTEALVLGGWWIFATQALMSRQRFLNAGGSGPKQLSAALVRAAQCLDDYYTVRARGRRNRETIKRFYRFARAVGESVRVLTSPVVEVVSDRVRVLLRCGMSSGWHMRAFDVFDRLVAVAHRRTTAHRDETVWREMEAVIASFHDNIVVNMKSGSFGHLAALARVTQASTVTLAANSTRVDQGDGAALKTAYGHLAEFVSYLDASTSTVQPSVMWAEGDDEMHKGIAAVCTVLKWLTVSGEFESAIRILSEWHTGLDVAQAPDTVVATLHPMFEQLSLVKRTAGRWHHRIVNRNASLDSRLQSGKASIAAHAALVSRGVLFRAHLELRHCKQLELLCEHALIVGSARTRVAELAARKALRTTEAKERLSVMLEATSEHMDMAYSDLTVDLMVAVRQLNNSTERTADEEARFQLRGREVTERMKVEAQQLAGHHGNERTLAEVGEASARASMIASCASSTADLIFQLNRTLLDLDETNARSHMHRMVDCTFARGTIEARERRWRANVVTTESNERDDIIREELSTTPAAPAPSAPVGSKSAECVLAASPPVVSTAHMARHAVPTGSLVAALSDVAPSMPLLGVAVAIRGTSMASTVFRSPHP
jgi:hypothetical protein